MWKRPCCGMAVGFFLGIWIAVYGGRLWLACAFAGIFLCTLLDISVGGSAEQRSSEEVCVRRQKVVRAAFCGLMLLLGYGRCGAAQAFRAEYLPYLKDGMQLSVQGELAGKQIKNNQYIYELMSCVAGLDKEEQSKKMPVFCNRILMYSDSDDYSIGEILVLNGTVELWKSAVNEGNFDAKSFFEARKTDFKLTNVTVRGVYGEKNRLKEALWELRLRLKEVYRQTMGEETCGIMTTMVLGDKELLEEEISRIYQVGGLSHVLAISGLHISVLGMSLYHFLRKRAIGACMAGLFAGGIMCVYGTMVGMGTSVRRSIVMFLLLLAAQMIGRSYDTLNSLGIAAIILLWDNPFLLWDAGFQFSFTAMIGVVWVGQCVRFGRGNLQRLLGNVFVSAAIQITTLPLVAWHYFEIPVYALALNLLILPLMGILLALGVTGGLVGLASVKLGAAVLFPCEKLLMASNLLCSWLAKLPGAMQITGRPKSWQMAVYYGLLAAITMWAYRKGREKEMEEERMHCRGGEQRKVERRLPRLLFVGAVLISILCVPGSSGFELDVLDVGQGDACFLRTGEGYTMFVDGGSSNVSKVGEYRILPFLKYKGVRRIDGWFVSHTDADHISGLREIFAMGYEVRRLVFSAEVVRDEAFEELKALAEAAGTKVCYLNAGDTVHIGNAAVSVLFPAGGLSSEDKNASSLALLYEEEDFSGIFTGDIGAPEEAKILEYLRGLDAVDFYKAAHHGSKYSNSEEFLRALAPTVSVVSCAKKNRYGHPGAEAVAHMEAAGSEVFYTMEAGQIRIVKKDGKVLVQTYLESGKRFSSVKRIG